MATLSTMPPVLRQAPADPRRRSVAGETGGAVAAGAATRLSSGEQLRLNKRGRHEQADRLGIVRSRDRAPVILAVRRILKPGIPVGYDLPGAFDDIAFRALADRGLRNRPAIVARAAVERIAPALRLCGRGQGVMRRRRRDGGKDPGTGNKPVSGKSARGYGRTAREPEDGWLGLSWAWLIPAKTWHSSDKLAVSRNVSSLRPDSPAMICAAAGHQCFYPPTQSQIGPSSPSAQGKMLHCTIKQI